MAESIRFPAGYVPAEAPIPDYVGLKNMPNQQKAAMEMGAPYAQVAQDLKVQDEKSLERAKADEFRKVLEGGPQLMYQFSDEITQKYPDFGKQLRSQVDGYAPLFKNPNMKGEDYDDIVTDFYKNAMDELGKISKTERDAPMLELKKRKIEAEIERTKMMAWLARIRGKNAKALGGVNAQALAKAWQLADTEEESASALLESLYADTSNMYLPTWDEKVNEAQSALSKARAAKQRVLLSVKGAEGGDFFTAEPEAKPNPPKPDKPKARKYSIVEVK